ncbi:MULTISPECIES: glycosyltransferase [unclassified Haladaptatus]|uniref:glycosyltransferase n=1 Tax=unclassified Haladaptatus TaxID=2622732 RepID=UPI00209BC862|nr:MULTISPECIES: glycosyltransferase [unclassified Haladaptatus]MCO8243258.1 glycosyltransferase [Haladaptatus sp. AB643]MCO8252969.1 glycosyltransferase [Haladaptatus sp. AB618]
MTLDAVIDQTYPKAAYEVLAVDNGSTDDTRDVIRSYEEQYPDLVQLLVEDEVQGPAAARNTGVAESEGSLLAFIDADMTVEETWLEHAIASMESNDWDYMGCNVEIYVEDGKDTLTAKYNQIFGFPIQKYIEEQQFSGTGCLFTRREVFDEVGNLTSVCSPARTRSSATGCTTPDSVSTTSPRSRCITPLARRSRRS